MSRLMCRPSPFVLACIPLVLLVAATGMQRLATQVGERAGARGAIRLGELGRSEGQDDTGGYDHDGAALTRLAQEARQDSAPHLAVVWGEYQGPRYTDARRLEWDRAAKTVRDYFSDGSGYIQYTGVSAGRLQRLVQRAATETTPLPVAALRDLGCPVTFHRALRPE